MNEEYITASQQRLSQHQLEEDFNSLDGSNHSSSSIKFARPGGGAMSSTRSSSHSPPPPAPPRNSYHDSNNNKNNTSSNNLEIEQELEEDDESSGPAHPPVDPLVVEMVRATQFGNFELCRRIIEYEGYDVNRRDAENVTLLHWAAINNRLDLAQYYISKGADIDAIGGDLNSTPLHWATRQGVLPMVVLLLQNRADPSLLDGDGMTSLHLAVQSGHTSITAYLVAKGADINAPDLNGTTALMWAAFRRNT